MKMPVRIRAHWVKWADVKAGRRMQAQEEAASLAAMPSEAAVSTSVPFTRSDYSGPSARVWS